MDAQGRSHRGKEKKKFSPLLPGIEHLFRDRSLVTALTELLLP